MTVKSMSLFLFAAACTAAASGAQAQGQGALTLSGNAGLTSDYRFRGVSQTEETVALQGGLDAELAMSETISLYAGTWGSTGDKDTIGAAEIDVYGGLKGASGLMNWSLGVLGYLYPDASGLDFYELNGEVGTEMGPLAAAVGVAYAPKQSNIGDEDGVYVYTNLGFAVPDTPVTLTATLGYEDNAFYNGKWDWSLGASLAYQQFTFGVAYVDTNKSAPYAKGSKIRNAADAAIIFSIGASF